MGGSRHPCGAGAKALREILALRLIMGKRRRTFLEGACHFDARWQQAQPPQSRGGQIILRLHQIKARQQRAGHSAQPPPIAR